MPTIRNESNSQALFREMLIGTLLYSVVIGFFNDYTTMMHTGTYSVTFTVAIVLQLLTYLTLLLKKRVVAYYKTKAGTWVKSAMVFSVWLILFFSKFVFLAVIDVIFGENVEIRGFVSLLIIIIVMTLTQQLVSYIYDTLATHNAHHEKV